MRKLVIRIMEAEMIPKGYGIAWREFATFHAICMPIPLNRIARFLRQIFLWFVNPWPDFWEHRDAQVYQRAKLDVMAILSKRTEERYALMEEKFEHRVNVEVARRIDEALKLLPGFKN